MNKFVADFLFGLAFGMGFAIAWAVLKLGWHVDQDTIYLLLGFVGTYILGQGIADHGKSAAEATASATVAIAKIQAANDNTQAPLPVAAAG